MTDRPSPVGGPAPRRWPADPTQLVDTTCCPACFSPLASTRCAVCGLDLAVPEADELLGRSAAVYRDELARQELIDRMRVAQAAREAWVDLATTSVPVEWAVAAPATSYLAEAGAPVASVTTQTQGETSTAATTPSTVAAAPPAAAAVAAPPAPPIASAASAAVERRSGRSGVQVLLLTLGVVLISVTAIVFLFVAYLVASLEVRSMIIAGASVLVLGLAWVLRARRLPGTAEGVASVAVVLLLLDVWIVRANELFGSERLSASAYAGVALAIVAGLLAATRAVSGIRVPGYAAAALAPVSAFLLAYSIEPETAAGVWLGGLATAVVGSVVAGALRASPERGILLAAGFVGGAAATIDAPWALPEVAWGASWALLGAGGAWLLAVVVIALRERDTTSPWSWIAAAALGASVALAPVVGSLQELNSPDALWIAPAGAVVVACLFAGAARVLRARREVLAGFGAAAAVAAAAAVVGGLAGLQAIGIRAMSGISPWAYGPTEALPSPDDEIHLGAVLVPLILAAGSAAVVAVFSRLRQLAAIPVAFAAAGAVVAASVAPTVWLAASALVLLSAIALAMAAVTGRAAVPGLLAILAVGGTSAGAIGWSTAYSSAPVWPWTIAALLALVVAGRLLAARVWPTGSALGIGAAHLAAVAVLVGVVAFSIPSWLDAAADPPVDPWQSPWMWLGTVASILLGAALLVPRIPPLDRTSMTLPLLVGVTAGAMATAFDDAPLGWLPATLGAAVVVVGIRPSASSLVRGALAAVAPPLVALALGAAFDAVPDAPAFVVGTAAGVLLAAAAGHAALPRAAGAPRLAWSLSVGLAGTLALASAPFAGDEAWLLLLLLAPVPVLIASLHDDPIAGDSPSRHVSWLSLPIAVGAAWAWLAGNGVDDVEAYTVPLAVALLGAGGLITWRRTAPSTRSSGRTALFASAAAVLVLPSVASSTESELRTLVLVAAGTVVAIAAAFLPEAARGVPIRLLGVAAGWVALTGAALVRGSAVAAGAASGLPVEFWPALALAAGAVIAVIWARTASHPALFAETMLGASVVAASVPTVLAILWDGQPLLRAAVLFPALAAAHIAGAATTSRPIAGPVFAWSTLGVLVLGGVAVLVPGVVDPFDVVTASVGIALIGAGAVRMSRTPGLGSWPALGPGLAVLLLPALVADFTDPELWRLITLGVIAAAAVVVGAARRLQAPLLLGGAVLLVHAIAQLWPWITWLYEAVWWWLWLGIAGVILVVLAATYERQLRLARGVARSIAELR
ncbi:SCO7613 C-terminal domain-containing membrane protein [Agromyces sp. Soil535]|uniref:SCO7613 C-terminal domain-containing membrane protein n=1 Tax=Agromyces sp. Soil535 TaxID=1736390 RepID=UPI000A5AB3E3|nr:hypothetical protein [Agromyces sp. Soil535]